jgi:N6-L-threonylcarbamoyladenine synthase
MEPVDTTGLLAGPILGIETSCDETAVALVHHGRVLTNRVATQVPMHQRFGGVVPEIAARNHLLTILPTIEIAMQDIGLSPQQLGGIAVTNRPGLIGALLVGVQTARTLALAWDLPLAGVDHIEAHVWAGTLLSPGEVRVLPRLPFLALAVSGGHTSLYRVEGPGRMTLLGRTLDDAAGEAFDKFARLVGLAYPGGPQVDVHARLGDPKRFPLPKGMRGREDHAFSFSGLKTAVRLVIERLQAEGQAIEGALLDDLCASFQAAVVEQLVRVTVQAAEAHHLRDLVIAGGVAANRGLREGLDKACRDRGLRCLPVPLAYCTDNGAMVAGLGEALLSRGLRDDPHSLDAVPTGVQRRATPGAR